MIIKRLGKSGSSFYFIYIIAMVVAMVLLYIIFSQVMEVHLQPLAVDQFQDSQDVAETTKFIGYWKFWVPLCIVVAASLFFFLRIGQVTQQGR